MTSERRDALVPARAARLARARAGGVGVRELLAFRLGGEAYALPLPAIREILRLPPITEVPRGPRDVLGIISVRGRITTVIDLRRRLRMPESEPTKLARVLVVDSGQELFGLLVDSVAQVYRLLDDEIEVASSVGADLAEYVVGIARPRAPGRAVGVRAAPVATADELLILLDPVGLLRR